MTAACGGGSSGPKFGTAAVSAVSQGYAAQLLIRAGVGELNPVLPLLAIAPVVADAFCTSDPPAMVPLTQAESDALLKLELGADFESGLQKTIALILNGLWSDLCECTSGPATLPPAPALPPNTIVTITPQPGTTAPCRTACVENNAPGQQPCQAQIFTVSDWFVMGLNPLAGTTPTAVSTDWVAQNPPVGGLQAGTVTLRYTAPGVTELDHTFNVAAGWTEIHLVDTWPGPQYLGCSMNANFSAVTTTTIAEIHMGIWCNGTVPNGTQQPCCPPDPATQSTLDAILKMVTLIQRYHVPFAYQLGAVHSGLAQSGSFTVSGLLGLKLDVVKTADGRPVLPGTPPYYWDQGWCSVMDGNGFIQETRLTRQSMIWLPTIMQDATTVGWWLEPNTQLTITEIEAEA